MKTESINRKLVRSLSFSITSVMIGILLLTDVAVDAWVHDEFNRAMHNKANLLTTLVDEDAEGVEFDFAGEFMPEFEGETDPEYYQLWRNGEVYERSETLDIFATKTLEYIDIKVGEKRVMEITLPDGRAGQVLYYSFLPQIDSDDREEYNEIFAKTGLGQQPMLLAYAVSSEKLNFLMRLIDISFFIAALLVIFIIRTLVKRAVSAGLKPLDEFTQSLKSISVADKNAELILTNQVLELLPIQNSINTFIQENRKLYLKEQRLTSDIAHELKTPIAELINLTEVSIKFPDDEKIAQTFKPDVLDISTRLQDIVANILLFHRYSNETFEKHDVFDVYQVLTRLCESNERIKVSTSADVKPITCNLFAFESIFQNLIKNADIYSPIASSIIIVIEMLEPKNICITVSNACSTSLSEEDLTNIFDPMWQKDSSRTSIKNFGLGLSIVQTFVDALNGMVDAKADGKNITFTVMLPIH